MQARGHSPTTDVSCEIVARALDSKHVQRKVYSASFLRDNLLRLRVSLDLDVPLVPSSPTGRSRLVPIGFFEKSHPLIEFQIADAAGHPQRVLTRLENTRIVVEAIAKRMADLGVEAAARGSTDDVGDPVPTTVWQREEDGSATNLWTDLMRVVGCRLHSAPEVQLADEALRRLESYHGLGVPQSSVGRLMHLLRFLRNHYLMVVETASREPTPITYSYISSARPDRAWGWRGEQQIRFGWRPAMLRLSIGGLPTQSSVHIEVSSPPGTAMVLAEYEGPEGYGAVRPTSGVVRIQTDVPSNSSPTVLVRAALHIERRAYFNFAVVPSLVSFLVLLAAYTATRTDLSFTTDTNVMIGLFLAVPALAYAEVLFRRAEYFEALVLSGPRRVIFICALLMFAGAGVAFVSDQDALREWLWGRLTLTAALVSFLVAMCYWAQVRRFERVEKESTSLGRVDSKITFPKGDPDHRVPAWTVSAEDALQKPLETARLFS